MEIVVFCDEKQTSTTEWCLADKKGSIAVVIIDEVE